MEPRERGDDDARDEREHTQAARDVVDAAHVAEGCVALARVDLDRRGHRRREGGQRREQLLAAHADVALHDGLGVAQERQVPRAHGRRRRPTRDGLLREVHHPDHWLAFDVDRAHTRHFLVASSCQRPAARPRRVVLADRARRHRRSRHRHPQQRRAQHAIPVHDVVVVRREPRRPS